MRPRHYLDYNASAPLRPEVRAAFLDALDVFGNASSVHWAGREARRHLERARLTVAQRLRRKPSEVIFTSGGSEADNLALHAAQGGRLLVSALEHPAVRRAAERLGARGQDVEVVPTTPAGLLDLAALAEALARRPTALVSVMAVNNETGVIQPLDEVRALTRAHGARLHVDAVQAVGRVPLVLEAELLTLSGHKLGAPKGVGVLLTRAELPLAPLVVGGAQERGLRAGTESVAHAVAFAAALVAALDEQAEAQPRLGALQAELEAGLTKLGARVVGAEAPRVANTTLVTFAGVEAETVLHALDLEGIAASSGSACASGSLEPSPVLRAMGLPATEALSALRLSTGWASTRDDVRAVLDALPAVLARARAWAGSPPGA